MRHQILWPHGQELRRQAPGASGVGGDLVSQQAIQLPLRILPVNRNQFVTCHEPKLGGGQARPVDGIHQQLAVVDVYEEVQTRLKRGWEFVNVVGVVQAGHVLRQDVVKVQIVLGSLHLGQPRGNIEKVKTQRVPLPFIWSVVLRIQSGESLEIRNLLIHRQLGITDSCYKRGQ